MRMAMVSHTHLQLGSNSANSCSDWYSACRIVTCFAYGREINCTQHNRHNQ